MPSYNNLEKHRKSVRNKGDSAESRIEQIQQTVFRGFKEHCILLDNIEKQVWVLFDPYTYGCANKIHADFLGEKKDNLQNRKLSEIFSPEESIALIADNQKVFREKKKTTVGEWINNGEGEKRLLSITRIPKKTGQGEIPFIMCFCHDITEKQRNEELIKQSDERYRTVIEDQLELICRYTPDGFLTFANKSYCDYFEKKPEELLGHSLAAFLPQEYNEKLDEHFALFSVENPVITYERKVVEEGSTLWQQWTERAFFDENEQIVEIQSTGRDITDHKLAAEKLKKVCDELQTEVKIRADQLKRAKIDFRYQVRSQNLLLTILRKFTDTVEHSGIDELINSSLKLIGEFDGDDRSYVFLFIDNCRKMKNTHEWCREGIVHQKDNLQNLPVHIFSWWVDKLKRFELIQIPFVDELPAEAKAEKELLHLQGVKSVLAVPLVFQDSLIGYIGFDSVRKAKSWSEESITLLWIVAQTFANALQRKRFIQEILDSEREKRKTIEDLKFLSQAAMEFVRYPPRDNLYEYIGRQLHSITPDSIVTIASFDDYSQSFYIHVVLGLSDEQKRIFTDYFLECFYTVTKTDRTRRLLVKGKFLKIPKRLSPLSTGKVPDSLYAEVEKELEIENIYAMGFARQGNLFGCCIIFTRKGYRIRNKNVIGTFINQASIALQRKQAEDLLWIQAHYDGLCGLPNRIFLNNQLDIALTESAKSNKSIALIFLDLDNFKYINDTLGHNAGDRVLTEVARRLKGCLRKDDFIARLGGDEFMVILTGIKIKKDAETVARKILACLQVPFEDAKNIALTASIGISIFPEDAQDKQTLLKTTDAAMYQAKRRGRNKYQFFIKGSDDLDNS